MDLLRTPFCILIQNFPCGSVNSFISKSTAGFIPVFRTFRGVIGLAKRYKVTEQPKKHFTFPFVLREHFLPITFKRLWCQVVDCDFLELLRVKWITPMNCNLKLCQHIAIEAASIERFRFDVVDELLIMPRGMRTLAAVGTCRRVTRPAIWVHGTP